MERKIGLISGGGIGPEIIGATKKVLDEVSKSSGERFDTIELNDSRWYTAESTEIYDQGLYDTLKSFFELIRSQRGIILRGPIQAPVLYKFREDLKLDYKLTPIRGITPLSGLTRYSEEDLEGLELLLVRNNKTGIFHAEYLPHQTGIRTQYHHLEGDIRKLAQISFNHASQRNKYLHLAMPTKKMGEEGSLWMRIFEEQAERYPNVTFQNMYPNMNNVGRYIKTRNEFDGISGPFDVIVGPECFMDYFMDDTAWVIQGELTSAPSVDVCYKNDFAVYQTVHGTINPIAGEGTANPIGIVHALGFALEHSYGLREQNKRIQNAIDRTLAEGYRTEDIFEKGMKKIGIDEMTEEIIQNL
jgi:3-isopropylmalate dehydrogenase